MSISRLRSFLYHSARVLGDLQAVMSMDPKRIAKRLGNKYLGRHIARRLWIK